jgi:hypothetical protein
MVAFFMVGRDEVSDDVKPALEEESEETSHEITSIEEMIGTLECRAGAGNYARNDEDFEQIVFPVVEPGHYFVIDLHLAPSSFKQFVAGGSSLDW